MNYLELIRSFWRSHEVHSFSVTEIALYFHLIEVCNICSWKNPFSRNNAKIMADLGIQDRRTLDNARNKLKQAGLIDFIKKTTNPNVTYTLTYTPACALNAQVNAQVDVQVTAQADVQATAQADDAKDKLNKTKLKKERKGDTPDGVNSSSESKKFIPPIFEEVKKYCEERGGLVDAMQFTTFYTSIGWMVGKNKMKDWKAAVRTWESRTKKDKGNERSKGNTQSNTMQYGGY